MTDKEIIIDGVNVARCEFLGLYNVCKLKSGSTCAVECMDCSNCYYKQLQRERKDHKEEWRLYNEAFKKSREEWEEQRSELIEKHNKLCRDFFSGMYCKTKYCEVLQAKEQECEKLKTEIKQIEDDIKNSPLCFQCKEKDCIKKQLEVKEQECDRYKQALEKIEEFVEPIYEQIPEDRVLLHILLMISEVI